MEGVGVFEVDGDGEKVADFREGDERVVAEEVEELDGSQKALDLVLPNGVPFVEGIFGGGAGEELDGSGLGSDG